MRVDYETMVVRASSRRICGLGAAVVGSFIFAGCTGGGSTLSTSTGAKTHTFGTVSAEAVLSNEPILVEGINSSVLGITGALSQVNLAQPTLAGASNQFLAVSGSQLRGWDFGGGNPVPVSFDSLLMQNTTRLSLLQSGLFYYASHSDGTFWRIDPKTRTTLNFRSGAFNCFIKADASKVVYNRLNGGNGQDIYQSNPDGTGEVLVASAAGDQTRPTYVGQKIVWVTPTGVDVSQFTSTPTELAGADNVAGTANGQFLATLYNDTGLGRHTINYYQTSGEAISFVTNIDYGVNVTSIALSPSGRQMIVGLADNSLNYYDFDTGVNQVVVTNRVISQVAWGFFPLPMPIVDAAGTYNLASNSQGIAFGMKDGFVVSNVVWGVATATTARLRAEEGNTNAKTMVMIGEGDRITRYAIMNDMRGYRDSATIPVSSPTVNTIITTFDEASGKCVSVITMSVTRSTDKLVTRVGDKVYVRGAITSVYDPQKGKVVSNGASEVEIDGTSVSIR